jgi:hypothetical protein
MLATRIRLSAVVSLPGLVDIEDMFFDYAQEFRKTSEDLKPKGRSAAERRPKGREAR